MSLDRRTFLQLAGLASGGLLLGVAAGPGCTSSQVKRMTEQAASTGDFSPNVFITVTPEDRVLVASNKSEMGQGVFTGIATLVAEELEFPVERVEVYHAHKPAFEGSLGETGMDGSGGIGMQITGGSSSTPENYIPVRKAAAAARLMLVRAAAKEWGTSPSSCSVEAGVVHDTGGERSLSFGQLTRKAALLDIPEDPPIKRRKDFSVIGTDVRRVDARDKSTGLATFGADVELDLDDKVVAYVVHPPVLGSRVESFDAKEAKGMAGVVDVFAFERGVAVLADKYWQARRAALTLEVDWTPGLLDGFHTDDLREAAIKRVQGPAPHAMRAEGDAEAALEASDAVVDVTYDVPYLAHAPMEPMNCTVHIEDGRVTIWAPNQSPTLMAEAATRVVDVDRADVTVHTPMLGGGFGRRGVPDFVVEALLIAKRAGRPVQLIWSREDDTRGFYYRPMAVARMRGAVDAQGRPTAMAYRCVTQSILADAGTLVGAIFPDWVPMLTRKLVSRANIALNRSGAVPDFISTEGATQIPYGVDHLLVELIPMRTPIPVSFWRSVGHSFNGFFVEAFVDELAHAAKADPVDFRRGLLGGSPRDLGVLEEAVKLAEAAGPPRDGFGRGVAVHKSFGTYVAEVADAGVVDGEIVVDRVFCAVDCGVALNPDIVAAQMESGIIYGLSAALHQRIDVVDGRVTQGNFDDYPALRMHQCPTIEVSLISSDEDPTGVGEPGLPPIAPAVSNALFAATGVRLRSLPLQDAWDAHHAAAAKEARR